MKKTVMTAMAKIIPTLILGYTSSEERVSVVDPAAFSSITKTV